MCLWNGSATWFKNSTDGMPTGLMPCHHQGNVCVWLTAQMNKLFWRYSPIALSHASRSVSLDQMIFLSPTEPADTRKKKRIDPLCRDIQLLDILYTRLLLFSCTKFLPLFVFLLNISPPLRASFSREKSASNNMSPSGAAGAAALVVCRNFFDKISNC